MKGFVKIALIVALIAIIVLSIVVASVAWFTSNPEVDAGDVTVSSARTLTVSFDPAVNGTSYKYNGQIGNVAPGEEDAPYVYQAGGFTVNLLTLSNDLRHGKIKVEFGTVTIEHPTTTISGVLLTDLFHVEANVYTQDNSGAYVKDGNVFRAYDSSTDGALTRYRTVASALTVSNDGVLQQTENDTTTDILFDEGIYELSFTYTFLPEDAYSTWLNACNGTASFADIHGYELGAGGTHIGVIEYVPYVAKYHYGLTRYTRSGTAGNYTYTPFNEGEYVRVIANANYVEFDSVTKYAVTFEADEEGAYYYYRGNYLSVDAATDVEKAEGIRGNLTTVTSKTVLANQEEVDSYRYLSVGKDYLLFNRYNQRNGFPYSNDRYRGEKFTFVVICSVEEV